MRKPNIRAIWFTAFLMIIFLTGCCHLDHLGNLDLTPPTVISVTPPNASTTVCPNSVVTATFSEAMNVATLNPATFTVNPGVTGTFTHDSSNTVFTFTPSSPLTAGTLYSATLTTGVRDLFGNALATNFVWTFTTAANGCNPPPTVLSVTPPNASTTVCPNSVVTATFSQPMNVATINPATFTVTPGVSGTFTHDSSNTVFTFTPSSPLTAGTLYSATLTTGARDLFGNALATNFVWTFTTAANGCNPPPTVLSVTPPNASTTVCPNSVVTATFSEPMNVATINPATFTVTPGVSGTITHDSSNTIFTFTPSSPLTAGTLYSATLTTGARDLFGNALATNFVWTFTTAANGCNPPPTVLSVTPPNASTTVCPNSVVTATFSQPMNVATLNPATFTVTPGVSGTFTHNSSNTVFTFTPSSPLAAGTLYSATLTTGARDLFGNALATNFVWTFTTAANGCNPPPTVLSVTPPNASTTVCPNSVVTATFSEPMNVATINPATFTVTPGVTGTFTHDSSNTVFTFTPSSPLTAGTLYSATLTTGVRDLFGNPLASNFVWTFTTAANGCNPPPTVLSVTPPNASTLVCPNSVVTATFSQPMNVATLNPATFTVTPGVTGTFTHDSSNTVFTFTPSSPLTAGTLYSATLTTGVRDLFGNALATNFVWTFTTAANGCNPPPTVLSVTPPNASTTVCPNSVVTATFSEPMNVATINPATFTVTPGVSGTFTHDSSNTVFTFTPSSPLTAGTLYSATLTTGARDLFGNALATNFVWTFTTAANGCNPPPTVLSVTPPNASTLVCPNSVVTATFNEAMNVATINPATFTVTPGVTGTITHDSSNTVFTFTPSSPLASGTLYSATLTTGVRDLFGNALATNFVWTFTTAANGCNPPPTVLSVTPPNASTLVCPNTIVTATFSQPMNPSSVDGSTFTLTGPGAAPVAGQVTYDASSHTAIFTPASSLALSTLYTATITTGVEDMFGNALAADFVWTFSTGANPCQPPSPPISVTPPNGSVGVCPNVVVAATFPQAMDPATINGTTFTVAPGVTGTITHDSSNTIFTFTPSGNLALSTLYTVTITTGAKDPFGNTLASNFVWSFTTGTISCAPPPPPTVVSVAPAAAAIGVCPNTVITATFSEAMDPATINTTTFTVVPGVSGTVTLDGTGRIASLVPSGNLALGTTYTATITTGVQDLFGNALASNFVWSFTTAMLACQAPVPMGSAANFDVLGASTVTNTGPTIISGGDLGLSPGSSVTGFPPGTLTPPAVMHVTDPVAAQAQLDLSVAYGYAAGLTGAALLPADMSGLTFTPGLYKTSTTVMLSGGDVTLDAQGNANAVFIFQIGSTLTTITSTQVVLAGGAQAKNIFWQVGSSATLGTNSIFEGSILALASITITTGVNLEGRALAQNGAVTLDSNTITAP